MCLHQLGNLSLYRFHDMESAKEHYERAIRLYQQASDQEEYDPTDRAMCQVALQEIYERLTEGHVAFGEGFTGL